ncbi:flagellar motor protein MotA [Pseudahrensia aquimaris]|uniref:Flagellar motor protein MotA n=1 Tax=Pseudahrensia aquimaris TaxID=744461 RepID=A0ABW3F9J8_9HYPH
MDGKHIFTPAIWRTRVAREYDPHRLSSPRVYLLSMVIFIALVTFLVLILYRQISEAFITNPGLNGLILGVLVVGVLLAFLQVIRLMPEVSWVNSFRQRNASGKVRDPVLLAPMAALFKASGDEVALSTVSSQSILDSIGNRLDERREISRYLIGLLVFLGLLGTFWGLLGTIGSIGDTIQSLDPSSGDTNDVLDALKSGLKAPLDGMGTAFSSSLFGLAGSLVLGFLDLQSGQAQNRFYLELENWLSSVTDLQRDLTASGGANSNVTKAMERLASTVQDGGSGPRTNAALANLAEGIQGLVKHMRSEQQLIRDWVETQNASQTEIKRLLEKLNTTMSDKDGR